MQASSLLSANWGLGSLYCLPLNPPSSSPTMYWAHSRLLSTALRREGRQAYYITDLKFSLKPDLDSLKTWRYYPAFRLRTVYLAYA